jgi:hypothetical protein
MITVKYRSAAWSESSWRELDIMEKEVQLTIHISVVHDYLKIANTKIKIFTMALKTAR